MWGGFREPVTAKAPGFRTWQFFCIACNLPRTVWSRSIEPGMNIGQTPAPIEPAPRTARRRQLLLRWVAVLLAFVLLLVLAHFIPVTAATDAFSRRVRAFGFLGPPLFGAAYIVATIIFIPAAPLTLAAGAVFGIWTGMAIVSAGSTVAAAASFLIARYLAHGFVERRAAKSPRFRAIEQAIAQRGWKMIALLRLSPVVPFTLTNYLLGLTEIQFWPYVLVTWIAMLPATFLYIYLGYVGRAAASGHHRSPFQWTMLTASLVATVALTVYISIVARNAVRAAENAPVPPTILDANQAAFPGPGDKGNGQSAQASGGAD